jgi:hypothetical protein
VNASTVERLLNKYGLKCRRNQKIQAMSEDNREERFMISRNFRRWSKQRLKKIFHSDESPHFFKAEWLPIRQEI